MTLVIRHTGLVVRDLDRSIDFYSGMFGLKVLKRSLEEGDYISKLVGIPNVRLEWAKLRAPDDSMLELLCYHSHPADRPFENASSNKLGCSHVALTIKDMDDTYKKLVSKGYNCVGAPQISPDGKAKVVYCHDPDGIILELVEDIVV